MSGSQTGNDLQVTVKKRSFDAAFKLKVVAYSKTCSNREAARKFSIDKKRVREWKSQEDKLITSSSKKRRLSGGRMAQLPDMEEVLVCWIDEMRSNNLRVTRSSIQRKSLELCQSEEEQPDFNASRWWLEKFMRRHGLSKEDLSEPEIARRSDPQGDVYGLYLCYTSYLCSILCISLQSPDCQLYHNHTKASHTQ